MTFIIQIAIAFLAGSIPFGLFVAKLFGVPDVRKVGSTNIGATNVVRAAGWKAGALTFLLDFLKAYIPMMLLTSPQRTDVSIWIGLAAVFGHCFSQFMKFKGGKGVSCAVGTFVALDPRLGFGFLVVHGIVLMLTRISALGALVALLSTLAAVFIMRPSRDEHFATALLVAVILYRHKTNWRDLIRKFKTTGSLKILLPWLSFLVSFLAPSQNALALKDFRGANVPEKKYTRIVALMPAIAEIMMDLGAGSTLIAAPEYTRLSHVSRAARPSNKIKNLGPYPGISAEQIYTLKPDLVIASQDGNDAKTIQALEKLKIPVALINTQSTRDIIRSVEIIAKLTRSAASEKILKLKNELSFTAERVPLKIFIQVGWNPLVTVSNQTYIGELVSFTGTQNIFGQEAVKYPKPTVEEVLKRNPDLIIICPMTDDGRDVKPALEYWNRFPNMSAVKRAGKTNGIVIFPVDSLTKPGFGLIKGVRLLREQVRTMTGTPESE